MYSKYLNKNNAKFIITSIEKANKEKASYGYLFNSKRLEKGKLLLPIDENENPDWNFMENYIKILEMEKIISIIKYYKI